MAPTAPFRPERPETMPRLRRPLALAATLLLGSSPLAGQGAGRADVFVNGDAETYLRALQVAGLSAAHPWSVRAFSPREVERLLPADSVAHPWAGRPDLMGRGDGSRLHWVHPEARLVANSAFPYGANDGPVWAGRGLTASVRGGATGRWGPLSVTLAPVAFVTQNAEFDLVPTGFTDRLRFADPRTATAIDLPQRFGEGAYWRVDPGESTVRLDAGPVGVGVSTATQHWGPASDHPLLLGSNAPGFPHLFLGTSAPVNVGVGRLHARLLWGDLRESDYSPAADSLSRRFGSGLALVFTPRGIDGLEIGASTFVHNPWPRDGLALDDFLQSFKGLYETGQRRDTTEVDVAAANQLASAFVRWVFPRAGVEVYGEYAREDQAYDLRDFIVEPDHDAAYVLGARKVWRRPSGLLSVRGEVLSTQPSHLALTNSRTRFYVHPRTRQGHTHRGQILGAAAGYGGQAATLAADWYHPRGRWTVTLARELRRDRADYPPERFGGGGPDVQNALGVEMLRFGGRFDLSLGLRGVYEMNRDFDGDAFNLNATAGFRAVLP